MFGVCGVYASARIYLVPGRPAWNSRHTIAEFFLTAATLGPLLLSAIGVRPDLLPIVAASAAMTQLMNQLWKFLGLIRSEEFEKQASARLLSSDLARLFLLRLALLALGGGALPLAGYYYREARFLQTLQFECNGHPPWLCEATTVSPDMLRFTYIHPEVARYGGGGSGHGGSHRI